MSGKGLRNAVKTCLGAPKRRPVLRRHFSTAPLTYWVREVRSETLDRLTEKRWSSSLEEEKFKPKNAQARGKKHLEELFGYLHGS